MGHFLRETMYNITKKMVQPFQRPIARVIWSKVLMYADIVYKKVPYQYSYSEQRNE